MPLDRPTTLQRGVWPARVVAPIRRRWGETSLRSKTLIIVAATVVALLTLISIPLRIFVLDSYLQLEERQVRIDVDRAANALADDLADLGRNAADYAISDDTYAFAADPSSANAERYLTDVTFASHRLSLFLLVDDQGRTIFGKAFDLTRGEPTSSVSASRHRCCRSLARAPEFWCCPTHCCS
jgi:sensor domain CHASE-containing protein